MDSSSSPFQKYLDLKEKQHQQIQLWLQPCQPSGVTFPAWCILHVAISSRSGSRRIAGPKTAEHVSEHSRFMDQSLPQRIPPGGLAGRICWDRAVLWRWPGDSACRDCGWDAELSSSLSLQERSCASHESDLTFENILAARSLS